MKTIISITLVLSLAFLWSCKKDDPTPNLTPKTIELTAKAPQLISSNNEFGIELFSRVASEDNENLMLSPLSASTALTMVLNGCDGETFLQLKETLKYPEEMTIGEMNEAYKSLVSQLLKADKKVTLALANAIFYDNNFSVKPTFLNTMSNDYSALTQGLDFSSSSALNAINKWASDNTNGKIPKVLDQISGDAVMFLMNALYFKGDWSYQFDKSKTTMRQFYLDNGSTVDVNTMNGEVGAKITYGNNYKAIELPYGRTNFTMVVIVPNETLASFTQEFTSATWNNITTSLGEQPEFSEVIVYVPKFKFSFEKILNDHLKSMGMIDAFEPALADFSGITNNSIFISFVKQNTFVEVNEQGTEAAAVTTVGFVETSLPGPKIFTVDKPFVFAIRERTTNTLMFIGQVTNPQ